MYEEFESQTRLLRPVSCNHNVLHFGGSDVIRSEVGAYGEKLLGSGSEYVQSSISRYFSNPGYYFQVNDDYVKNKLKVVLFPFLHKGHWIRRVEAEGGKFSFKPPIDDINAPDLYIPMMAFATYILLSGFFLGFNGKFDPESLGIQFNTGLLCWLLQVLVLEGTLHLLGGGEIAVLDMVAYAGYTFVAASVIVATRLFGDYLFCAITLWESFCMGILLLKTMKRILISELQSFDHKNATKRNYILLFMVVAQIPLLFWLGNVALRPR